MVVGVKYTVGGKSRKVRAAAQLVNKARTILRARSNYTAPSSRPGGFYRRGRAELKVIDVVATAVTPTGAGAFTLLNGVSQGTDYLNRIGRKAYMKSILLRATVNPASGTSRPIGNIVRAVVFWDLQANGAAPVFLDLFQANADVNTPLNLTNRDRFRIISDKFIVMNPDTYATGAPTAGNPITRNYKVYRKCNQEVIFGGTNATVASIQTGSLYICVLSQGTSLSTYTFTFRTRFEDV